MEDQAQGKRAALVLGFLLARDLRDFLGSADRAADALGPTHLFTEQVDLDALRQKIANNQLGGKALAMVRTTTEEVVRGGNLAALNYRFEPMGPYPAGASAHATGQRRSGQGAS